LKKAAKKAAKKKPKTQLLAWPKPKSAMREVKSVLPVSKQSNIIARAPKMNGGRGFRVVHREWLQQIVSVQNFTGAGRYIVQPGLTDNFPWLGQLAANFENYNVNRIRYVYRNRSSTNSAFTIYMASQYDVSDAEFKSIEEIMNYTGAKEEVCWRDFTFDVKPQKGKLMKKYMVRTDTLPTGLDPTAYDCALFTICGVGSGTAGTLLGELMVEYDITFTNPKMNPSIVSVAGVLAQGGQSNPTSFAANPLNSATGWVESKGFSQDNMPLLDAKTDPTTPVITFPVPGAYKAAFSVTDFGSTGTLTAKGFAPAGGTIVMNNSVDTSYTANAGKGISQFCDVITTTPYAKIAMTALSSSGSSAAALVGSLQVACESLPFILDIFGSDPDPPLYWYEVLSKAYPKHDLSKMKYHYEGKKRREELKEMLAEAKLDAKDLPPIVISRRLEVQPEQEAENSDGDVVEIQPRSRSVDKRSKSSERKT
jgi:DNA-directed RNA polymerase subunit H (RpoH/RPB5)